MKPSPSFINLEEHGELEDDSSPTTVRSGRVYQHLVRSERPTVPPPAKSHIRDLLRGSEAGAAQEEDDDRAVG